jgi:hypothetical protein
VITLACELIVLHFMDIRVENIELSIYHREVH